MRHSCEHVLTMAMLRLWGNKVKAAMGPAIEEGFYFDFDSVGIKVSETDFPKIEEEMAKIIKEDLPILKGEMTVKEAKKFFNTNIYKGNEYKHEWLDLIKNRNEKVSIYWMGKKSKDIPETFVDICSGPHAKSTGKIGAFKLLSVAGAYWHGSEKNKMLTRIYGTCFSNKKELDEFLKMQEEAEASDHRKIGKDLDLFIFSDLVGKGLPLLTEKGANIRRELEKFVVDEEIKRGYKHVLTPVLAKTDLYKKSGHYPYYKDTMYPPMKIDDEEFILRPMTCPHHFMLYKSRLHSYKELPLKIAEISPQFRYEKSGELTGLMRVRTFCLADAHIIAKKEQAKEVIKEVLDLIDFINSKLGLVKGKDYRYRLSLGDRKDQKKYFKDDKSWSYAEKVLRSVLKETKAPYYEAENEAAFYGPKIDIQVKKISGKEETAFTVQYDFVMPKRFDLTFINEGGQEEEPIVIHRSSIGAFERTMAFLIEKYKGSFPVWLSPTQVWVIPVSQKHFAYSDKIAKTLLDSNLRVEAKNEDETLSKKIRAGELQKIPYLLIVGDRELKAKTVSVRQRKKGDLGAMKLDGFIVKIKQEIEQKNI